MKGECSIHCISSLTRRWLIFKIMIGNRNVTQVQLWLYHMVYLYPLWFLEKGQQNWAFSFSISNLPSQYYSTLPSPPPWSFRSQKCQLHSFLSGGSYLSCSITFPSECRNYTWGFKYSQFGWFTEFFVPNGPPVSTYRVFCLQDC